MLRQATLEQQARLPMDLKSRLLGGTTWITLAEALSLPTGFLTLAFLTRQLGADGYGLFALTATLISWIEWAINSVFARTTIKLVSEAEDRDLIAIAILKAQLGCSLLAASGVVIAAPTAAALLHEPTLTGLLRLFAIEIPLVNLAQAHQNILTGMGKFNAKAVATAVRWIARMLFILCLVGSGLSISGAIIGSLAAMLADLMVCRCYIRPSLWQPSEVPVKTLVSYAVPLFTAALATRLYAKVDLIALKALGGTAEQAGIYAVAQNLALLGGIMSPALAPVLIATVSQLLRAGEIKKVKALSRSTMRVVILHLPFAGLLVGAAGDIVPALFGKPFVTAAPLFAMLILATVGTVMIAVTSAILVASNRPWWMAALSIPMPGMALIGDWLLIPHWGAMGASVSTLLVAGGGALAGIIAIYLQWRVLPPVMTLVRCCLVGTLVALVASHWATPGAGLLLKLPVLGGVILLSLFLLGEVSAADRAVVRSFLRSFVGII
jgi:O-antigen/teichoic acid export membrane protein